MRAMWFGFVVYMLVLVKLILFKQARFFLSHIKHFGLSNIKEGEGHLILIPFHTTWRCLYGERGWWEAIANIGGNILGFVPMGIMLPILFSKLNSAKRVITTVSVISLCFELTQFIIGVGYCDIDDLIQNTLGGAIGYYVYKRFGKNSFGTSGLLH